MCKIHNSIGSLTTVKSHLKHNNIHNFNSAKEVLDFQNNFSALRSEIISNHEQFIEQEKAILDADILQLDKAIQAFFGATVSPLWNT